MNNAGLGVCPITHAPSITPGPITPITPLLIGPGTARPNTVKRKAGLT